MKASSVFSVVNSFLLFLFGLLVLAACATSPKAPESTGDVGEFALLPAGGRVYLWADVRGGRSLLEALSVGGFRAKDAGQVLDRTDTAAAAFFGGGPVEGAGRFFLVGRGKYPNIRAGISMTFSRDWKKAKSPTGNRYWYSPVNGLGVALGPELALAAVGDPFAPEKLKHEDIPGDFFAFLRGFSFVAAGWIPEPREPVNVFLASLRVPLQIPAEELFFGAARAGGSGEGEDAWELVFRVRTPSAREARALVTLFSLARIAIASGAVPEAVRPLFINLPEQDENILVLRSGPMNTKETALLFSAFSVYSIQNK
jgi:hypothetical protein